MVASTISNSGGPGSPTELSPVTIAVRDKVIEKFKDQPLREMNESLKMLLSNEQDEQKRLGILAARVYILRQRITTLAEPAPERVVSSASPKPHDTDAHDAGDVDAGGDSNSEWTRLRILDDCEVNGVRFPKTVIIDVKSSDAQRLIDSGNAELVEELPETAGETDEVADASDGGPSAMQAELDAAPSGDGTEADASDEPNTTDSSEDEEPSANLPEAATPVMETSPAPEPIEEDMADASDDAAPIEEDMADASDDAASDEENKDAVIEAPSAAEVTAALEALGAGPETSDEPAADSIDDVAELAAALAGTESEESADTSSADDDEAAAVAAELEAAAAAMAAPSAPADAGDDDAKPNGWFEAQQNAEKAARAEPDDGSQDTQEDESPADEKS